MNCRAAELYMEALLGNELAINESVEIVDHIENCRSCKEKWELNEETRSRLKHYLSSIKAPESFRNHIKNTIIGNNNLTLIKPMLIAASIIFLIGLGISFNPLRTKIPTLTELHNNANVQLATNDTTLLSKHIGIHFSESYFSGFEKAHFKPHGATKFNRPLNQSISILAMKNDLGDKISICYLPENFKTEICHTREINGTTVFCGRNSNCEFAYWKEKGKTIALVSDTITSEEMISLAIPFIEKA